VEPPTFEVYTVVDPPIEVGSINPKELEHKGILVFIALEIVPISTGLAKIYAQ